MKIERIKEIQQKTAYPDSVSVQQALLKVWNECEQERVVNKNDLLPEVISRFSGENLIKLQRHFVNLYGTDEMAQEKANSFAVGFAKACELMCKDLQNGL